MRIEGSEGSTIGRESENHRGRPLAPLRGSAPPRRAKMEESRAAVRLDRG